jgi:alpha-galactosidase
MTPADALVLLNKEAIAVDQDPLGIEGMRIAKHGQSEVWCKPLKDGSQAVVLFNRSNTETLIEVTLEELRIKPGRVAAFRDLWRHKNLGGFAGSFAAAVPTHGAVMLRAALAKK